MLAFHAESFHVRQRITALTLCALGLCCLPAPDVKAAEPEASAAAAPDPAAVARFYWQYAALAADVYRTQGVIDRQIALALASPWLREEVRTSGDEKLKEEFSRLDEKVLLAKYRARFRNICSGGLDETVSSIDSAIRLQDARCKTELEIADDKEAVDRFANLEPNWFVAREPRRPEDCDLQGGKEPAVPVTGAAELYGWEQVPELQRQTAADAWKIFVPDLAIDVWRRPRTDFGATKAVEYAVVYRGTVGGGGWVSNMRAVTAITPFVWDQYNQALESTSELVNQIYRLHAISDTIFSRKVPTRVLITTVGHSLGAGLARYIYLQIPQVTRVVGFDPSPIDGSSMVAVQDRPFVMTGRKPKQGESADDLAVASAQVFRGELIETAMRTESGGRKPQSSMKAGRRQPVDHDPIAPGAAIFMLHERGEILSLFAPCQSGEIWGSEGGPRVACHVVNWSSGNPFRQHNMAELACRMSLCFQGISPRRDREVCSSSLQTSRSSP